LRTPFEVAEDSGLRIDGIEVRDRVWLDRTVRGYACSG
jgi:hypothetical protein